MQNRTNPMRRHSRFPVSWPVLYGNEAFLAEGTVLDLTARGWRVAGPMPVVPGMQLTLQVSVPERPTALPVHRATVLWVHDHEFAIEAHEMLPIDQAWVTEFLRQKLGLMWMPRTTAPETSLHARDKVPHCETALPESPVPSIEDILHRFLAIETAATDIPFEARCNGAADCQEGEAHTCCDRVSEKTWHEAHRILRGIVAVKAARERTGWDLITGN
ncbi:MAG: PilZ domain-containing protein [Nitrospira sp.]|nr:PilZ domain-containing protein [Nitrospira sp.]